MKPFTTWFQAAASRRTPVRRARLAFDVLEDRRTPATLAAPDMLTQYDTGISSLDNLTAEPQPVFAGATTSPAGSVISLVVNEQNVGSFVVTQSGGMSFTIQPNAPLADGAYTARFHDSHTAAFSSSLAFEIDIEAPLQSPTPTVVLADDPAQVLLEWTGQVGERVHLVVAGLEMLTLAGNGAAQQVAVDVTGLGLDLAQPFDVWTIAEDAAGNRSSASDSATVTLPPPQLPAFEFWLDPSADTGVYDDDGLTQADLLVFTGYGDPGLTVTLYVDGQATDSQFINVDGWFLLEAGPLAEGPHQIWVGATGPGIDELSPILIVTIDRTAPVISDVSIDPAAMSPNGDGIQDDAGLYFTLSETAFVGAYFYDDYDDSLLGVIPLGLLDAGEHVFDLAVPEFLEGSYTVVLAASDIADNISDLHSVQFVIDLTPPDVPIFALDAGYDSGQSPTDNNTNIDSPRFVGFTEPGAVVQIYSGDQFLTDTIADAGGFWSLDLTLSEGEHEILVVVYDEAGNWNYSDPLWLTIDTTAPVIDAGADVDAGQGTPVTLDATVDDPNASIGSWELVSGPEGIAIATIVGPTLTFTPQKQGVYRFRFHAVDPAGNIGEDYVDVNVAGGVTILNVDWPQSVDLGSPAVVQLGFSDPNDQPLDSWIIHWGDGTQSTLPGSATSATHVYSQAGSFTATIEATQGDTTISGSGAEIVVDANVRPTLTHTTATAPQTLEDALDPAGASVAELANALGIIDSPESDTGLAITAVHAGNGTWQYSVNGSTWLPLGAVSDSLARFLAADDTTRIRFVPAANWNGIAQIAAHAWDQSDAIANGSLASLPGDDHASVSPQSALLAFPVAAVNDAPILLLPSSLIAYRNTDKVIGSGLSVSDVDAAQLRVTITISTGSMIIPSSAGLNFATGNGTPHLTLDGPIATLNTRLAALVYRPVAGYLGPVTITVTVNDLGATGQGGAQLSTREFTFDVVNRPPQIVAHPQFEMNANTLLSLGAGTLKSAFIDPDGDALSIVLATPPAFGTLVVNPDGSFQYTPPYGYVGTVSFAIQATDGVDLSEPLWIHIHVKTSYGLRR